MAKRKPSTRAVAPSEAKKIRLAALEIPEDCGCKFEWIYSVVVIRPGDDRHREVTETRRWFGPPCKHVLARDHSVSFERWAELLWAELGHEYWEPPRPTARMRCLERAPRLAMMMRRHDRGEAIRHKDDANPRDGPHAILTTRKDGPTRLIVEEQRGVIEHDVPDHVMAGVTSMATCQRASRLVCRHGQREDDSEPGGWYSVREDQATLQQWDQVVLRVNPETIRPQDALAFLFGRKSRGEDAENIDADF